MPEPEQTTSVVFRGGTVLPMDDAHTVLTDADVLVVGDTIAAVGPHLDAPPDALEVDARGGIVMPGMIDTHRHMWQTAMRGYGADWTLTQYFVWYYLEWGKKFRPQDVYAWNLLSAIESLDSGVTTTVHWSHGLQTIEYAAAATDALEAVPALSVLAYGNIRQGPWEWSTTPEFRDFYTRRFDGKGDMLGFQIAFDLPGDESFPEKATFEVARELGVPVTTHAGVWGVTTDTGIRLMYDNGFCTPRRCPRIPTTRSPPPAASCRSRPRASATRARAIPPPGSCAGTASRSRSPRTPASGGAATSSPPCGPRSTRTGS